MKSFSLVVFAVVLFAAFAQGAQDCSTKCLCSNVPNKTEFCGILGIKRVTFGSSCEMLCFNCQNKTNFKYQSPGKCPTPTTAAPAGASTAKAALPTTKKPSALAQAVLPSSTKKPAVAAQAPLPSSTRRPAPAIPAGSSTTTKPKTQ